MKLGPVRPMYPIVKVPCFKCGGMVSSMEAVVDYAGPSYKAFYHPGCVPKEEEVKENDRENS